MGEQKENPRGRVVKTLTLASPVKHGAESVTMLEFVELRGEHLFEHPAADATIGDTFAVAARLAGVPMSVMGQLGMADLGAVNVYVEKQLRPFKEAMAAAAAACASS